MDGERGATGEEEIPLRPLWPRRFLDPDATYTYTRFVFLRLVGLVYFVPFFSLSRQLAPLIGHEGLMPADRFLDRVARAFPGGAFFKIPTLFLWLGASDATLEAACSIGVALSLAVLLGATNALLQFALWALYLSFVNVGQIFYGYGWEIQLCETGFLAIFLCPVKSIHPFPRSAPPVVVIWLLRWLIVRIMWGAGLIKLRGDPCWRDFTCLIHHYETQPVPSPLSWVLHQMPRWYHVLGVAVNHVVELIAPFFAFGPRRARHVAGLLFVGFQVMLISSGNLSFLNWLTIAPALACFDDSLLSRLFPARARAFIDARVSSATTPKAMRYASYALALVVLVLSANPVANLLSSRQAMNTSFDPFSLVNTYGAFGSVGKERYEVILEGTSDAVPEGEAAWKAYELPCKPGDVARRPCVITPYHYRLDWQMWFAGFMSYRDQPWIVHLVYKLLSGDRGVKKLFANDPFPGRPPRYVRATLYRYRFTKLGDGSGAWWQRERVQEYLPPLSVDDPWLLSFLDAYGWEP